MTGKDICADGHSLWYKDAVIYEVHVKSFYDSNGDGIGDFRGLIEKLGYLEDLGVTVLWLLPFYPSPRKDDGYDISDYYNVHPDYGTLKDFRDFLRKAHQRGIKVITELVVNHTSDQHPWFQRARQAKPGSAYRNFYVWSDTADTYGDARIIFKDFESSNWRWDPVAQAYFWHRFYSHQPDLNYDNPQVQKSILKVMDFWLEMGVDGLRLDAVPYLYERDGTNCENLPETHTFLKKLRAHVDRTFKDRMLLAEANQWPEDAVAYFGTGDECHMAFHFPIMPRMFMALWMEDRFPLIDILDQTPEIPFSCQWGVFLRNHDELTLEMVTDEERDYMNRVYARDPRSRINLGIRRRLAPLMQNNRRKMELMNFLLFSLPGTPIIYYGDEIAMGDNYYLGDRDGVRTPMQWSPDRNAGFSKTNPQQLYLPVNIDPEYHYEAHNVENHERNPSSLLCWMRRVIAMRRRFKAFGRGSIKFLFPENPRILAFVRQYQDETVLVVVNLSRYAQAVELDLSEYAGLVPEEVFSGNKFPVIKKNGPYVLTPAANDYYWFVLRRVEEPGIGLSEGKMAELQVETHWQQIMENNCRAVLEETILPEYLYVCRWFSSKTSIIKKVSIQDEIPLAAPHTNACLLLIDVQYTDRTPEGFLLPVCFVAGEEAAALAPAFPQAVITRLTVKNNQGLLVDGAYHAGVRSFLLSIIAQRKKLKGRQGSVVACPGKQFKKMLGGKHLPLASQVLKAEQSNTSILYDGTYFLKLYRRLAEGMNPDTEIVRFLSEKKNFSNIPMFAGTIEYQRPRSEPVPLGLLQSCVANQGDAWTFTLAMLDHYWERIVSAIHEHKEPPAAYSGSLALLNTKPGDVPHHMLEAIGAFYIEMTGLLGKRTAQMHQALASAAGDPEFAPEPFSKLYQRSLYQSMRSLVRKTMQDLEKNVRKYPKNLRAEIGEILKSEPSILKCLEKIMTSKIDALKIRIHGDYHLGQVLYVGNDFLIIDFEGEPARPVTERRLKRSPLRDVAGMIRSFHYAAYSALFQHTAVHPEHAGLLAPWADQWYLTVSTVFLRSYLETVDDAPFVPRNPKDFEIMLNAFLLEKAVYELDYELNNRPDWVAIPMQGIRDVLGSTL